MADFDLGSLPLDQQHLVRRAAARLEPEFEGTFGPETIERFLVDSLDRLTPTATVTIRDEIRRRVEELMTSLAITPPRYP